MLMIGIDASNIKAGGGVTHLSEIIQNYSCESQNKIVLFANKNVLETLNDHHCLVKSGHSWLDRGSIYNTLWRLLLLRFAIKKYKIEIVFTPGANFLPFTRYVSMSQNMLVFESKERNRFPSYIGRMRYRILEVKQLFSFRFSAGIIYISEYAKNYIQNKYPFLKAKKSKVIYHGVAERFNLNAENNNQLFSASNKFRLLYVSIINYYKHQDKLIEGIMRLRSSGIPVELHLIGPLNPKMKDSFEELLRRAGDCVIYHGKIPYEKIHEYYSNCDLFVFASTCENMPNILVEAMKTNVPVLCSNYGPMPEILKDGGIYFDPLDIDDLCDKILLYMNSVELRIASAKRARELASAYSWPTCSEQTFNFINFCHK